MEDGLVQRFPKRKADKETGLNPCCNGRWSRTDGDTFINKISGES